MGRDTIITFLYILIILIFVAVICKDCWWNEGFIVKYQRYAYEFFTTKYRRYYYENFAEKLGGNNVSFDVSPRQIEATPKPIEWLIRDTRFPNLAGNQLEQLQRSMSEKMQDGEKIFYNQTIPLRKRNSDRSSGINRISTNDARNALLKKTEQFQNTLTMGLTGRYNGGNLWGKI